MQTRYLIVGGGTAGQSAAQAVRSLDADGSILIAAKESELPYNRPMLTKALEQMIPREKLLIKNEAWYQEKHIDVHLNTQITSVDMKQHTAVTSEGDLVRFDKLILAMGANSFVPPIPGADLPHVFTVRTISDVHHISERLPDVQRAVVIGGGVLGLEAAWSLTRYGAEVTVIEQGERVMQRQLDEDASARMLAAIEGHGTRFRVSSGVREIAEHSVFLLNGEELPADMVILSTGIVCCTALAKTISGVCTGKGIKVNEFMETGVQDVYACGDCAELNGRIYGQWQPSSQMGKTAGMSAAGEKHAFFAPSIPMLFNGYGTSLCVIGDAGYGPGEYETATLVQSDRCLEKLWFKQGVLTGVSMVGDTQKSAFYKKAVADGMTRESLNA